LLALDLHVNAFSDLSRDKPARHFFPVSGLRS
jgi:hypothetical protein